MNRTHFQAFAGAVGEENLRRISKVCFSDITTTPTYVLKSLKGINSLIVNTRNIVKPLYGQLKKLSQDNRKLSIYWQGTSIDFSGDSQT